MDNDNRFSSAEDQISACVTDEDLVLRIRTGDQAAFRLLMERHLRMVRRLALNILADAHEAEDVAQETFVAIWKNSDKWESGSSRFTTWLHRVAINKAIDARRRRKATPEAMEVITSRADAASQHVAPSQVAELEHSQASEALKMSVGRLPEGQRQAITLYYFEEQDVDDVATTMNLSEQAVRSLLKRGRVALRHTITKQKNLCWHDPSGFHR